jgi:hypothetical protein
MVAFPFASLAELPQSQAELAQVTRKLLNSNQNFKAEYTIESTPGKDFQAYHQDLGTAPENINDNEFLSNNHKIAVQTLVWGIGAFDLVSLENVNGITTKRQRLLADGLLVDYFPERPSAYIRSLNHPGDYFTLYDLLNLVPSSKNSLADPLRANGWGSILETLLSSLESSTVRENDDSYTITFFRQFPEYDRTVGFEYRLEFTKQESAILLAAIEVALADSEDPNTVSFRNLVFRNELSSYTEQGLPQSVESKMWRYARDPETNEYRQYLVREIKCVIQSIDFADSDYDFSLNFDVGTFVTDEMTGSQYRVGNPLNALMEEVAE